MMQKFAHLTAESSAGDGIRSLQRKLVREVHRMTEAYYALGIVVAISGIGVVAYGLVYLFGGKKMRAQMRSEW